MNHLHFLATLWGRGLFYLFTSAVIMTHSYTILMVCSSLVCVSSLIPTHMLLHGHYVLLATHIVLVQHHVSRGHTAPCFSTSHSSHRFCKLRSPLCFLDGAQPSSPRLTPLLLRGSMTLAFVYIILHFLSEYTHHAERLGIRKSTPSPDAEYGASGPAEGSLYAEHADSPGRI